MVTYLVELVEEEGKTAGIFVNPE